MRTMGKITACPMTDSQKGVYLECINEPGSLQYNVPMLCRFSQKVDAQRLIAAVRTVVHSHPALHMNACTPEGVPSLRYQEREIDVAEKTVVDVEQEIAAFICPFDLENEPLCRFELLHTPEGDALLYDIHHLVFDGTSTRVLSEQILRVYQGEACPEETLTVFDAAEIERAQKDTDEYRAAQAYFAEKLTDCDAKPVPDQTEEGVRGVEFLTLDVGEKLTADEAMCVEDFLQTVYEDYYQTKRHAIVPFGELKEQYEASTDVSFIYQDVLLSGAERGGVTIETELLNTGDAPVSLDLMVRRIGSGYALLSRYQSALYTEGLVRSFAKLYCNIVRGMLMAQTLGDIALTDEADEALLDSFNRTEADYDAGTTVVALFRAQAKKTPENVCLAYSGKRYTYREVDELTDALASQLVKCGVEKEKVAGVLIPRCEHMLLCSLGVLKAGGAYLPLDPTYPPERLNLMMCTYETVKQSKVLVRSNGAEDYLVGFFTAETPVDLDALTAHLKTHLTEYMVPAVLLQLDAMPLTPNGKIDKNGFPEVQKAARKTEGRRKAKKSLEQRLCEIFGTVLGLDEVFADDSFFALGGTSLSASKVTMLLMSDGIEAKYGDIFDHPTPEGLAEFIEQRDGVKEAPQSAEDKQETVTYPALRWNQVKYTPGVKREGLGNVLLTGAVGFLGTHILRELIECETEHIYCLVRRGRHESAEVRLRTMPIYYFSNSFEDAIRDRITLIEADITDASLSDLLADVPFDTVINCAVCVKHFSDSDILEQINVHGVENLIDICMKKNAKLVQISTVSVPGIHTKESYKKQVRMHENELFVIDDMDNKYGISKYHAELKMLDAIDAGLRGKIIRCGNLMGRHSDGEFQANLETNMFMSGIRGFATMGKYPISHMTDPMRFSPVDCTARAIVLLAGVNDKFTAFNFDNRYGFDEMKIIDACNRNGIKIVPAADEEYYAEFQQKLGDDRVNARLHGVAAYDIKDAHAVDTDNLFTTNVLYRIGFSWPLVDGAYLDRAIHSVMTMDYFAMDDLDED